METKKEKKSEAIIKLLSEQKSVKQIAEELKTPVAYVYKIKKTIK
jgi:hypothetical protein